MNIDELPIDSIEVGDRLRLVDEDWAAVLAESIAKDGQGVPIDVRPSPQTDGRYLLVAGAHRMRAIVLAGGASVLARVLHLDDLHARLHEINENLIRHELTELDRATFLAERQAIYDTMTREDVAAPTRATSLSPVSPTHEAVRRLKLSKRTIQRAIARHNRLTPDIRGRLVGTWLADSGQQLDQLAKLPRDGQHRVVDLLFGPVADGFKRPKGVNEAIGMVSGAIAIPIDLDDRAFEQFLSLWRLRGERWRLRVHRWATEYFEEERRSS